MKKENSIILFNQKGIRRIWDEKSELWYFSVVDVISVLTESTNPQVYWRVLKKRLSDEGSNETVTNCNGLKINLLLRRYVSLTPLISKPSIACFMFPKAYV